MSLQNRVLPDGRIVAQGWRGTMMGNRGGRIHNRETKTLMRRGWASKRWIICQLSFKGRQRRVMGDGYTELFFLDEASALAAGHRPCFECRRTAARAFASAFGSSHNLTVTPGADAMDRQLHSERVSPHFPEFSGDPASLPDGTFLRSGEAFLAVKEGKLLNWSQAGYSNASDVGGNLEIITPPSIRAALAAGYKPQWHPSAMIAPGV
ncbi:MAG: hypothetical protein AAFN43_08680 [Pseudomonadota bacterium]